jgi:hypothetical protein
MSQPMNSGMTELFNEIKGPSQKDNRGPNLNDDPLMQWMGWMG